MKIRFFYGHIGRFNHQKNHEFLIKIVNTLKNNGYNVKLLLVGDGEKRKKIQELVQKLQLEDNIIFGGIRRDIPQILSAIDILLLPSFYEGMPNVVIEAQAVGTKCFISDTITKEANITGLVKYLSIERDEFEWRDNIINEYKYKRADEKEKIEKNKYDINITAKQFIGLCYKESNTNDN